MVKHHLKYILAVPVLADLAVSAHRLAMSDNWPPPGTKLDRQIMHGKGTFFDPRLNDPVQFPVAARAGFGNVRSDPNLISAKLPALHFYQLALPAPAAPDGSFDSAAAGRGKQVFETKARCSNCHVPPTFTEPGWNMHTADEIGLEVALVRGTKNASAASRGIPR